MPLLSAVLSAVLSADTCADADSKPIPSFGTTGNKYVSSIPQLRALFEEAEATAAELEEYVHRCEQKLTPLLASNAVPDDDLANQIATAKVRAVEASIDLCFRLKQEVGSFALMGDSGFAHMDFLQ